MKPFAEAATPLPPRAEQVSVLTTKVPSSFIPKTEQLFRTTMIEEAVFHIPGVDLSSTLLTAAKASIPSLFPAVSISTLLSIKTIPMSEQKIKEVTKSLLVTPQALKKIVDVTQVQIQAPKPVQIQMPKPIQIQIPISAQIQEPFQFPVQIQKPFQVTIQEPVQIPKISIPKPPIAPTITPPPEPPKPRIKIRKKKTKKKKKSGKPKKGIFELRVDTIVSKLLKELKI